MKKILILLFVCFSLLATGRGQTSPEAQAKEELKACARAYTEGHFEEAEQHAYRAVAIFPDLKNGPVFLARSIHAQVKPDVKTAENQALAQRAIIAYEQVLQNNVSNEEAFEAVSYLYGQLEQEETQIQWITQRAYNVALEPRQRANAFVFLVSKEWQTSYDITESPYCKMTSNRPGRFVFTYRKPCKLKDFKIAQDAVARGQELVEQAITLDSHNEHAWGYKTNLLLEAKKLAEMEKRWAEVKRLGLEVKKAEAMVPKLIVERREREERENKTPPVKIIEP